MAFDPLPQLQQATGIAGHNELWLNRGQMFHFPVEQRLGHVRMHHVINAGAAAAPITFGHVEQFNPASRTVWLQAVLPFTTWVMKA